MWGPPVHAIVAIHSIDVTFLGEPHQTGTFICNPSGGEVAIFTSSYYHGRWYCGACSPLWRGILPQGAPKIGHPGPHLTGKKASSCWDEARVLVQDGK